MTLPQVALVLHALALIGALTLIVPALTEHFGGPTGYLLSLCAYWIGFCLPVWLFHVRGQRDPHLYSERLHWREWWIPILLLIQVCALGMGVLMTNAQILTTQGAMLATMIALINGPLEEIAWRGGFMTRFATKPRLGFWLSWLLYAAWHAPLLLAQDIVFEGGWMALILGAALLGLLWSWIAWRTGSVFWTSIAHVLTNVLTFWVLFNANGFVSPYH